MNLLKIVVSWHARCCHLGRLTKPVMGQGSIGPGPSRDDIRQPQRSTMKNMSINHAQKGFTLIELMIVVAIIGILAAIAIPQYQDYIARSQISRAVGEVSSLKTAIEEELMRGADPSTDETAAGSPAAELGFTTSDLMGAVPTVGIPATGAGSVTATLNGNVSSAITGTQVVLTRTAAGSWTCVVVGAGGGFSDNLAPAGCPAS